MSSKLRVEVMRESDAIGLFEEVRSRGFDAALVVDDASVAVEVDTRQDDATSVGRRLWLTVESWIDDAHMPLVPMSTGERTFLLRPPLG
jgi:hypothetical protein